jgi:hypothetical protein
VQTILERKATPMLPEPTIPKPSAAAQALSQQALSQQLVMTPLFVVPEGGEPDAAPPPGRRSGRSPGGATGPGRRTNSRVRPAQESGPRKDPVDLLAVTAQRLRKALARSFLRYGVVSDLETAVHAAMNVIEPVLEARDTEILRLRRLVSPRISRRLPGLRQVHPDHGVDVRVGRQAEP